MTSRSSELDKMLRSVVPAQEMQGADFGVEAVQSALLDDGTAALMTVSKLWVGIEYRVGAVTRSAGFTLAPPAGAQLDVVVPVNCDVEPSQVDGAITLEQLGVLLERLASVLEALRGEEG